MWSDSRLSIIRNSPLWDAPILAVTVFHIYCSFHNYLLNCGEWTSSSTHNVEATTYTWGIDGVLVVSWHDRAVVNQSFTSLEPRSIRHFTRVQADRVWQHTTYTIFYSKAQ